MKKIKIFRRGKFVGLVNQDFYSEEKENKLWEKLELPQIDELAAIG